MKRFYKKLTAALAVTMVFTMLMGVNVFAMSTAQDPHFDIYGPVEFEMTAGESKEISWFCDCDYYVVKTRATSDKTALMASGKEGSNYATVYIGADELSSHVVFYLYQQNSQENYEYIAVNVKQPIVSQTAASATTFKGSAKLYDATHGIIYGDKDNAIAAFAVIGQNKSSFVQLSVNSFMQIGDRVYLAVTTPVEPTAKQISISAADKQAALQAGIYGLVLNGKVVEWP